MKNLQELIKNLQQKKSYAKKEAEKKLSVDIHETAALRGKVQAYDFVIEQLNLLTEQQANNDTSPQLNKPDVRYQLAISALQKIKDPIAHMKQELKEGEELNGYYAVQLSNDAHYLRSIAEQGLNAIANCT
jgi:hypothetical protein